MFRKFTLTLAVAGAMSGFAGSAAAGSSTSNLSVTASVASNCTISTAAVAFGAYDPIGANAAADKTGAGTVSVTCTKNSTGITVGLGLGSNATGSTRRMLGGTNGDFLTYELYQPSATTPAAACALTTVWGTSGVNLFTPTGVAGWGAGAAKTFNVCGNIPQAQNVAGTSAGEAYTDTVVATVNF